jgi:hypothetical protein
MRGGADARAPGGPTAAPRVRPVSGIGSPCALHRRARCHGGDFPRSFGLVLSPFWLVLSHDLSIPGSLRARLWCPTRFFLVSEWHFRSVFSATLVRRLTCCDYRGTSSSRRVRTWYVDLLLRARPPKKPRFFPLGTESNFSSVPWLLSRLPLQQRRVDAPEQHPWLY